MKLLICISLVISSAMYIAAQQETAPLPVLNDDIIQMSRAGVLPAVVIAKIKHSYCRFDTSPSALVSLKQAGVADEVLMEMVRNPNGGIQLTSEPAPPREPSVKASRREAATPETVGGPAPPPIVKRDPSTFRNKSRFSTQYDKFKDQTHVSVGRSLSEAQSLMSGPVFN